MASKISRLVDDTAEIKDFIFDSATPNDVSYSVFSGSELKLIYAFL